jgi:hypothetical protein
MIRTYYIALLLVTYQGVNRIIESDFKKLSSVNLSSY